MVKLVTKIKKRESKREKRRVISKNCVRDRKCVSVREKRVYPFIVRSNACVDTPDFHVSK